tara:strand:- start:1143 stop:2258 length:1116 start_codon:yes stop_codon:yes gene_type:complete
VRNKKIGIVIQGKTFLKSMFPLCLFANQSGFEPIAILYKSRPGKPHDNIDFDEFSKVALFLQEKLSIFMNLKICVVEKDEDVFSIVKSEKIDALVCQDMQYHLKQVLSSIRNDKSVMCKTFSICNFFDSLHHAYDLHENNLQILEPDGMFFPDTRFETRHESILGNNKRCYKKFSVGNTFYDHYILNSAIIDVPSRIKNDGVVFFTTLQNLVPSKTQDYLESFLVDCLDKEIPVFVKTKLKTPWAFKNQKLKNLKTFDKESGIPGTSLALILNTAIQISSYSTSAVEAEYFGKPTINLPSVSSDLLTKSVKRIKEEYKIESPFHGTGALTPDKNLNSAYDTLVSKKLIPVETPTVEENNSLRILREIKNCL